MRRPPWELVVSFVAVAAVAVLFVGLAQHDYRPSGPLGMSLGVVGFLMMLASETLYSLRKRVRGFHVGPMHLWLEWHVVTGIVGPFLVLLHSAGKFHGLAGVLAGLTVVIVISGFVGRHIYTAVPRTLEGTEVAALELNQQIAETARRLHAAGIDIAALEGLLTEPPPPGWMLVLGRAWFRRRRERKLRRLLLNHPELGQADAAPLRALLAERLRLQMQAQLLSTTRNLLAIWHLFHVPLGIVVFTLAFLHIGAALYYASWWK